MKAMERRTDTETIQEERTDARLDEGGHDRFSHYVDKDKLTEALINGTPVIALCGKVWVPSRDPEADAPRTSTRGLPALPLWLLVMVGLLYAVLIGEFGRYSWPATAAVIAPAGAGLVFAWHGPSRPRAVPRPIRPTARAGAVAWVSLFIALGLWELSALLLQPTLTTASYAPPPS